MNTHFRRVLKSDHLGAADLEDFIEQGKSLVFTIKEVKQYVLDPNDKNSGVTVAGRRIGANIVFFKENIKPLCLNATNANTIKGLANGTPFIEEWKNIRIELFIDKMVKMKGEIVGGIRIKAISPAKPELTPKHPKFEGAKKALKAGTVTIEDIKKTYVITPATEKLLK